MKYLLAALAVSALPACATEAPSSMKRLLTSDEVASDAVTAKGDFDGDGRRETAGIYVDEATGALAVAVTLSSKPTDAAVVTILTQQAMPGVALRPIKAADVQRLCTANSAMSGGEACQSGDRRDGIEVIHATGSRALYRWTGDKFVSAALPK